MPAAAALIAVPLALTSPVIETESVSAGVVVGFATVPAKPLAGATETLVTDPPLLCADMTPFETVIVEPSGLTHPAVDVVASGVQPNCAFA